MSNCQMLLLACILVVTVSIASHHSSLPLFLLDVCALVACRLLED
jgi:hypothetical protein